MSQAIPVVLLCCVNQALSTRLALTSGVGVCRFQVQTAAPSCSASESRDDNSAWDGRLRTP